MRPRRLRDVDAPQPAPRHATALDDPEAALARRLEVGRQSGVREAALERYAERAQATCRPGSRDAVAGQPFALADMRPDA